MQKPQRPKKRDEQLGQRHYDWKDWEKKHNHMTGLSCNRLFDVYQRNENVRIRNSSKLKNIQKGIDKLDRLNRKQLETLREHYKEMMAYAYVYRLHSIGAAQNPDNDDIPLIRKRVKPSPAQAKPKDPDIQILPKNILEYYDKRPKSFRLPPIEQKWRPASFAGDVFHDNQTPGEQDFWINDPYPTMDEDDIRHLQTNLELRYNAKKAQLPALGTCTLKLATWQEYGNQNKIKPQRNALSEPPSRWRGHERSLKSRNTDRPKSYMPVSSNLTVGQTPMTSKKFYDDEVKKTLPMFTFTHRRIQESQKLLNNQLSDPFTKIIDSRKTTSEILREYRQRKHDSTRKGPIKVPHGQDREKEPKSKMFQNWVVCDELTEQTVDDEKGDNIADIV